MNRNNLWRFVIVILVVAWALFEMYPPTNRPLIPVFREQARGGDETFGKIIERAQALTKERPDREYENLKEAVGTNDITGYFPQFKKNLSRAHPTASILNSIQREAMGRIHLGIDLQGGTSFLVEMDTNNLVQYEYKTNNGVLDIKTNRLDVSGALSQAVEVLRKRVDQFGVAEPVIQPEGNNRISIQLPGLSAAQMNGAESNISKVAFLQFYIVHEDSDNLIKKGNSVAGYKLMTSEKTDATTGQTITEQYLVKKEPAMTGGIQAAWRSTDNFGRPEIEFQLDAAHADQFAQITGANIGRGLAIVLDGELQSAPTIQAELRSGGVITGHFTDEEARNLANVLQNPLQAPVHIIDKNEVDPTLGKDSIRSGIIAVIIGVLSVAGFMLIYYMIAGAIADVALILNIIILVGVMCSIETTFTLPGIAGVVLTVGMAVDANVLIFERIREESAKGKSLRGALQAGYDRAFGTIFDSHVTTLISSVILIFMGTGSVKGFGVSLTIGVAASLFTALVVTRLIFDFLINRNIVKKLPMLHLIPATMKLDFMKLAIPAFVASWLLILVGIGFGIHRGNDVFGVEFTGGEKIVVSVDSQHKPEVGEIRNVAKTASGRDVLVAYQKNVSTGVETLQVTARDSGKGDQAAAADKIFQALKTAFPNAQFGDKPLNVSSEGPIVGEEIQQAAIVASLLAMFGILVYVAFRYEFSFAVGAVVAIIHDVLMTLGWYFLAGRELNATTVAAVLTIIGFSINDTIVIFDRIREDLRLGVRGTFRELVNQALNQTLSRTIITSGTVFLATVSLFIFGGGEINDFAFTFLIGILTGTYSSIYIASAIVLWWHKGHRPKIGSATQTVVVEPNAPAR
jgi:SecD/SecF fusion protein